MKRDETLYTRDESVSISGGMRGGALPPSTWKGFMVSGPGVTHEDSYFLNKLSQNPGLSNQNNVSGMGDEDEGRFLWNTPF